MGELACVVLGGWPDVEVGEASRSHPIPIAYFGTHV